MYGTAEMAATMQNAKQKGKGYLDGDRREGRSAIIGVAFLLAVPLVLAWLFVAT